RYPTSSIAASRCTRWKPPRFWRRGGSRQGPRRSRGTKAGLPPGAAAGRGSDLEAAAEAKSATKIVEEVEAPDLAQADTGGEAPRSDGERDGGRRPRRRGRGRGRGTRDPRAGG